MKGSVKNPLLASSIIFFLFLTGFASYSVHSHPYPKDLMAQEWNGDFWKSFRATRDITDPKTKAVQYSRTMEGTLYDPLMGGHGDYFGKHGLVVCIDVPVRSYLAGGISMPVLLKESAKAHPEWFSLGPDNPPDGGYFCRRVRNYYDLFKHHPWLESSREPRAGDWAFYGRFHIALVTSVDQDGSYELVEADPHRLRVVPITGEVMAKNWGQPDFFGRIRSVKR